MFFDQNNEYCDRYIYECECMLFSWLTFGNLLIKGDRKMSLKQYCSDGFFSVFVEISFKRTILLLLLLLSLDFACFLLLFLLLSQLTSASRF